jgi:hypothetical protein
MGLNLIDASEHGLYDQPMSTQQLAEHLKTLPLAERVDLAQALWESIDNDLSVGEESDTAAQARSRDQELTAGIVVGRTHEEVMDAARRALACM